MSEPASNPVSFSSLPLKEELLSNLGTLNYQAMTPIQAASLPHILAGKDVIAQGQTGSGKTAAFGLGILNRLNVQRFRIQALVLCPTRELADQVAKEIRRLARAIHNIKVLTLCGGMPFGPQLGSLEHGAHIIVGTPGRVEEHVRKGTLDLKHVDILVLDEADRMLDMGFQEALDVITQGIPTQRQTLLLSATYPDEIKFLADALMQEPEFLSVASTHDETSISQQFIQLDGEDSRFRALRLMLLDRPPSSAVIFCNTKRETQELAELLSSHGFSALAIHGDLDQRDRDLALVQFSNQSVISLVATDVASRGLDIDSVDLVVNYHLARDPEVHVHRVGRTGRAGKTGRAITFFTEKESHRVERIEAYLGETLVYRSLPPEKVLFREPDPAPMRTIQIDGGKKQKVRAGDILGALTRRENTHGKELLSGEDVGKIQLYDLRAFVAVKRSKAKQALSRIVDGKMKGRQFRARLLK